MSLVKVFVPTFRRHRLLRRALASLIGQSHRHWVAEVHNDDPHDPVPGELVRDFGDSRLTCHTHSKKWGATPAFNFFFQSASGAFTSILEDDNLWEPDFLARMLAAAQSHSSVQLFWANQRISHEREDGSVEDTDATVWPVPNQPGVRLFDWGTAPQCLGALHGHGAMLLRPASGDPFTIPDVPAAFMEPFRERMLPHPIALVETPLARFTFTRTTARSDSRAEHLELQTMLAATFLRHAPWHPGQLQDLWDGAASQSPPATAPLLLAACHTRKARIFWSRVRLSFLIRLAASLLARPTLLQALLRSRRVHAAWWDFLDTHTARRFQRPAP